MGYESKLIIVEGSTQKGIKTDLLYARKVAEVDLCKMGHDSNFHKLLDDSPDTKYYYYSDDGGTQIVEDRYGDKLKSLNINQLIEALEQDNDGYRRVKIALALLKGFKDDDWTDLEILHFGY
jgi:hypothetical protein